MTAIVIDSTDKPKVSPEALIEYSREIVPMLKELIRQKDLLKDFKESDDVACELAVEVKEAKDKLDSYIENDEIAKSFIERIKEIELDIKVAVKGAARVCDFKPVELKAFFLARVKETVDKTVDKGIAFATLEELLK
jgi:hypothetical protein